MQDVVEASWVNLRSLPPKEAIVAVVLKAIVTGHYTDVAMGFGAEAGLLKLENEVR